MSGGVISVLLPTRGRPEHARRSIESLKSLAADPSRVEVLVRVDDDDATLPLNVDPSTSSAFKAFTVSSGERWGYNRMHDYYGHLAGMAEGDWLFVWNDDTEMRTQGWDALLREAPPYSIQFIRRDEIQTQDFTFPILGRTVYEAIGFVAENGFADAWLSDVACFSGVSVSRDDVVFHHHRLIDQTARDNGIVGDAEWRRFQTPESRAKRWDAMNRIIAHQSYEDRFAGWDVEERPCNVDYINLAAGKATARSYFLKGRAR